ncbi:ATP-binding protein [Nonomuraea sp. NPDC050383]|uniref:ATP-binding protein n=1 Tax=Nonomuraea sp. NPDC050383 TaxID=3364362 RepID=UPI0037B5B453
MTPPHARNAHQGVHPEQETGTKRPPGTRDLLVHFPGVPSQVSRTRRLVAAVLGRDHPLYDDCALLTSELATNAILHSRSGAGGWFTVGVRASGPAVRVWVADAGSEEPPCACRTTGDGDDPESAHATNGRGLPLLEALSHRWGLSRADGATTVWFELTPA